MFRRLGQRELPESDKNHYTIMHLETNDEIDNFGGKECLMY